MENSNQYTINNVQQLFSLNQNLVNFKTSFSVSSLSKEPFFGIVVDQQMLDSGETLEFKSADKGLFSGDITQDNNIATNWYLVLKSTKPNKVVIDIKPVEIPPSQESLVQQEQGSSVLSAPSAQDPNSNNESFVSNVKKFFSKNQRYLTMFGVGVLLVIVAYFGYKYYKKRYAKASTQEMPEHLSKHREDVVKKSRQPIVSVHNTPVPTPKATPKVSPIATPVATPRGSPSPVGSRAGSPGLSKKVAAVLAEDAPPKSEPSVVTKPVANELGDDLMKQIEKQLDNVKLPPV